MWRLPWWWMRIHKRPDGHFHISLQRRNPFLLFTICDCKAKTWAGFPITKPITKKNVLGVESQEAKKPKEWPHSFFDSKWLSLNNTAWFLTIYLPNWECLYHSLSSKKNNTIVCNVSQQKQPIVASMFLCHLAAIIFVNWRSDGWHSDNVYIKWQIFIFGGGSLGCQWDLNFAWDCSNCEYWNQDCHSAYCWYDNEEGLRKW